MRFHAYIDQTYNRTIDEFAVLGFAINASATASAVLTLLDSKETRTYSAPAQPPEQEEHVIEPVALDLIFTWPGLQAGDCIGIVIAARSATPLPFQVILAAQSQLDSAQGLPGLEPRALAEGYRYARHVDLDIGPPNFRRETRSTGNIDITDTDALLPTTVPGVGARAIRLTTTTESSGYSLASGGFLPAGAGGGRFLAQGDFHGTPFEFRGTFTGSTDVANVTGRFGYIVQAEGQGPAVHSLEINLAQVDLIGVLQFWQLDFGATLQDLLGVPAFQFVRTTDNLPTVGAPSEFASAAPPRFAFAAR